MNQPAAPNRSSLRSVGLGMGAGLLALVGLGLAGCGSSATINSANVDASITSQIKQLAPSATVSANCPTGVKAEKGATFECPVTVNGEQYTFKVTQADDTGAVSVASSGAAFISLAASENEISQGLTAQTAGSSGWQTTCKPEGAIDKLYITQPKKTFTCTATGTGQDGNPLAVGINVTVVNDAGEMSWKTQSQ